MTRQFDRTKKQLVMSSASLEDLPSKMRTPVSMTAEGTPTFTVLSMQQMKLFGIGYGELSSVSMEHIVNVRAVCELAVLEAQGVPLEEALMKVHSVQYAQTQTCRDDSDPAGATPFPPCSAGGSTIRAGGFTPRAGMKPTQKKTAISTQKAQNPGEWKSWKLNRQSGC